MGDWSPGAGGGDWLLPPQWAFDEELPQHPVRVPTGNGRPELRPYTYRGSDGGGPGIQSHPEARGRAGPPGPADDHAAGASSSAHHTPRVREATGLDDPALTYAGVPVSAPPWWIRDYEQGDL